MTKKKAAKTKAPKKKGPSSKPGTARGFGDPMRNPGQRASAKKGAKWSGADARKKKPAKGPRAQTLPGMQKMRDTQLDGYCEDAGEGLDQIASGTAAVLDARQAAMRRLISRGLSSYVHAGVRFTYSPGIDKVSVKRVKEKDVTAGVLTSGAADLTVGEKTDAVGDERRNAVDELGSDGQGVH